MSARSWLLCFFLWAGAQPALATFAGIVDKAGVADAQTEVLRQSLQSLRSQWNLSIGVAFVHELDRPHDHPTDADYAIQVLYDPATRYWNVLQSSDYPVTSAYSTTAVAALVHQRLSAHPRPDLATFQYTLQQACQEVSARAGNGYAQNLWLAVRDIGLGWIPHLLLGIAMGYALLRWTTRLCATTRQFFMQGVLNLHLEHSDYPSYQVLGLAAFTVGFLWIDHNSVDLRGSALVLYYSLMGMGVMGYVTYVASSQTNLQNLDPSFPASPPTHVIHLPGKTAAPPASTPKEASEPPPAQPNAPTMPLNPARHRQVDL